LPDNCIDAYIQDPPFEVSACEWDKGFIEKLPELWELWIKKGKTNAPFLFKATFPFIIDLINSNRKMFKYEWIWKKNMSTNFVHTKTMPLRCTEYILLFYKELPIYNPILIQTTHKGKSTIREKKREKQSNTIKIKQNEDYYYERTEQGFPINIIEVPHEKDRYISNVETQKRHPNRTNPEVWKYFIKTYTNEGDLIFDGYTGSGSVPQAAIELNRNWIACENSEEYFSDTQQRILNTQEIKEHGYAKTELTTNQNSLFFGSVL
ncbi:MAG: DNA methyltransferase, partial [Fusobacteriaceae bacterium]